MFSQQRWNKSFTLSAKPLALMSPAPGRVQAALGTFLCAHTPSLHTAEAGQELRTRGQAATTSIDWFQPPGGVCKADGTPGGDASIIPQSMWYQEHPKSPLLL